MNCGVGSSDSRSRSNGCGGAYLVIFIQFQFLTVALAAISAFSADFGAFSVNSR